VSEILNFLQVPRHQCARIVEVVAIESANLCEGPLLPRPDTLSSSQNQHAESRHRNQQDDNRRTAAASRHSAFDTDDPSTSCDQKRRGRANDDYGETRRRWMKMASEARRRSSGRFVSSTSGAIKTRRGRGVGGRKVEDARIVM
jgi:hypothetical protein